MSEPTEYVPLFKTVPGFEPTHVHYKGGIYQLLMIVEREADLEPMAVYRNHLGRGFVRPLSEFKEKFRSHS